VTAYSRAKTGNIRVILDTIASILRDTMIEYLALDIFPRVTVRAWKTIRFSEQIIPGNKFPSLFPHQMEAIVYKVPIH